MLFCSRTPLTPRVQLSGQCSHQWVSNLLKKKIYLGFFSGYPAFFQYVENQIEIATKNVEIYIFKRKNSIFNI